MLAGADEDAGADEELSTTDEELGAADEVATTVEDETAGMDEEADEATADDEVGTADDVADEESTMEDELAGAEEDADKTAADDVVDDDAGGALLAAEELDTREEDPGTEADEVLAVPDTEAMLDVATLLGADDT